MDIEARVVRVEARRFSYHVAASWPVGRRCGCIRECNSSRIEGYAMQRGCESDSDAGSDAGSGGQGERTPLTPTPPLRTVLALLTIPPVRALALPHPSLRPRASSIHHPDNDSHGCTTPRPEPTEWQYAVEALGCVQAYCWPVFPSLLLARLVTSLLMEFYCTWLSRSTAEFRPFPCTSLLIRLSRSSPLLIAIHLPLRHLVFRSSESEFIFYLLPDSASEETVGI
jgi:hypothetical protein